MDGHVIRRGIQTTYFINSTATSCCIPKITYTLLNRREVGRKGKSVVVVKVITGNIKTGILVQAEGMS